MSNTEQEHKQVNPAGFKEGWDLSPIRNLTEDDVKGIATSLDSKCGELSLLLATRSMHRDALFTLGERELLAQTFEGTTENERDFSGNVNSAYATISTYRYILHLLGQDAVVRRILRGETPYQQRVERRINEEKDKYPNELKEILERSRLNKIPSRSSGIIPTFT